jgi:hypothetical protein
LAAIIRNDMTILKTIHNSEFKVFVDNKLIYTKFLDTGEQHVLDSSTYNKYLDSNWKDLEYQNKRELIIVKARLKLLKTEDGGRKAGFISGYRPNHVFEYRNNQMLQTYIGDIQFDGQETIEPGEEKNVVVRFLMEQPIERYLSIGRKWWIHEGARRVGEAEILSI